MPTKAKGITGLSRVNPNPNAWVWGPLPETRDFHIMWSPGGCLMFCAGNPAVAGTMVRRILHHSANGNYDDLASAEAGIKAFLDAEA